MRTTSKGQASIPQNVREQMGFLANTEVEFFVSGNKVFLRERRRPGEISDCLHEGKGNCGFAHE
ncbi:MAG: AbrB/MazE/SpoVT family DNA-binding domain-containing protein [Deltaproteobacteria bacterium]|jgi:bifunctional DNA-binding transcriptional regulator/antitoxin component of YhaV-PrlF toxin-antitoxin module